MRILECEGLNRSFGKLRSFVEMAEIAFQKFRGFVEMAEIAF